MLEKWWQQFLERNKRVLSEVVQIQMEMARKNPRPGPNIFPHRTNSPSMVIIFWVILVLLATGCWVLIRRGAGHP
jgi:hypothetical protein